MRIKPYVESLRIKQWIKAGFVFAPLLFSGGFRLPDAVVATLLTAIAFCFCASGIYVFNDICDIARDRQHPTKRYRAIARGAVPIPGATILATVLCALGVGLPAFVSPRVSMLSGLYVAMNIVYSRVLKGEVFVDVMVIAIGFVLRVLAGARAVGVEVSCWMVLTTFFLALFLGFGKRREEIVATSGSTAQREVMRFYSLGLLNGLIFVTAALTITTYSLYALTSGIAVSVALEGFVWTVPLVVFGVFRYLGLVMTRNGGGDPAEMVLRDRLLIADVVAWIGVVVVLLSLPSSGGAA
jgi:4-hydroxybenzoate polyprenyltransferase